MAKKNSSSASSEMDDFLEKIASEEEDKEISPIKYEILAYPADYTLEVLARKMTGPEPSIIIPSFQRKFVWKLSQSSKLIESFLLGLPVPPVFLYVQGDEKLLVVDGQQRLRSIAYFFAGYHGEEKKGKRPVFRLTGLNEKSPFADKTVKDLEDTDPAAYRRLCSAVLRSFVIKQLNPKDDSGIYHVFERLNTGGTRLHSQEIRNCIYHGKFNNLALKLNKYPRWRELLARPTEDSRRRDVELIVRFFALHYGASEYKKPMTDFISKFMANVRNPTLDRLKEYTELFQGTVNAVLDNLGARPFHVRAGLNTATFDAVMTAFASNLRSVPAGVADKYQELKTNKEFIDYTTYRTTDDEIVIERIKLAKKVLFGGK